MKLVLKIVDEYIDGEPLGFLTVEGFDRAFSPAQVEAAAEALGIEYEVVPFVRGVDRV